MLVQLTAVFCDQLHCEAHYPERGFADGAITLPGRLKLDAMKAGWLYKRESQKFFCPVHNYVQPKAKSGGAQ